jgi:hypothetical protein
MKIYTHTCKTCKNTFTHKCKLKKTCSTECLSAYKKSEEYIKNLVEKQKKTFLAKYGVEYPTQAKWMKEKIKKTNLERYGFVSPTLNPKIREKQEKTNMERYGYKTPLENKEIFDKTKKTLMENYNNDITWKIKEIVEKSKQTKIEKYGNENYNNREKVKKTNLKKYGVENLFQSEEIKEKIKQTCLKKYGVEHFTQTDSFQEKMKQTCLKKYGVDNVLKNEEIKERIKQTCLKKYGKTTPLLNEEFRNNAKRKFLNKFYQNSILNGKKFINVIPLFTENEYEGNISYQKKYPFQCKICNTVFEDTIVSSHIPRCLKCYPPLYKSQFELYEYIQSLLKQNIVEKNIKNIIYPLELDIYIPSKQLAIEFNGLHWHTEIGGKKYKNYHLNKTIKCKEKGIRLIHIFEDEWTDKKNIIKNKLKHILGCDTEKIYARKCIIKEIDSNISDNFLEEYHIQGKDNSSIKLGAYYNDELVAVMTFGCLRLALGNKPKNNEYEMYRFCVGNKNVVGIGGKFFSYFIKTYKPEKIISYADKRWSDNNSFYNKIGMKLISESSPNYWYIYKNNLNRIHRFNFRKNNLSTKLEKFDPNLTEWENMQLNEYDRIWDCGNIKYEWLKS